MFERQTAEAMRLLKGIENGMMSAADLFGMVEETDPALLYLVITWLRRRTAGSPNADVINGRLLELVNKNPTVSRKMTEGHADPVVQWFEDEYSYKDLSAEEFIPLIIEKLEG